MCSNLPQLPPPPISNRELPTADGPWVCLPRKLQHDKKVADLPETGRLRLDPAWCRRRRRDRRAAIDRAAAKQGGETWCLSGVGGWERAISFNAPITT